MIQGAHTDPVATEHLCKTANDRLSTTVCLYNYRKDGSLFRNFVQIFPLYSQDTGNVTHYLGFFQEVSDAFEP